jgi:ATP-dependent Clp protease ATP-binding subunit ClpX
MYDLPSLDNVSKVVVDAKVVTDKGAPLLIYSNNDQKKAASDI